MSPQRVISYELRQVHLRRIRVDVVALKYAKAFRGADQAVIAALAPSAKSRKAFEVAEDAYVLTATRGAIRASHALVIGVPRIHEFLYEEIRRFSALVLTILAREAPDVRTIATTLHAPGYGLDVLESARQQFLGFKDAIGAGSYPEALKAIAISETKPDRLEGAALAIAEEQQTTAAPADWEPRGKHEWPIHPVPPPDATRAKAPQAIKAAVKRVAGKPEKRRKIFVAMPFDKKMRDLWRFGIRAPVRKAEFLCERVDERPTTGGIMARVLAGIEEAELVVAVLTGNNPNVFLETGYSWGRERPTLFLCEKNEDGSNPKLPFDVAGHTCLFYEDVTDLEKQLEKFLRGLDRN